MIQIHRQQQKTNTTAAHDTLPCLFIFCISPASQFTAGEFEWIEPIRKTLKASWDQSTKKCRTQSVQPAVIVGCLSGIIMNYHDLPWNLSGNPPCAFLTASIFCAKRSFLEPVTTSCRVILSHWKSSSIIKHDHHLFIIKTHRSFPNHQTTILHQKYLYICMYPLVI